MRLFYNSAGYAKNLTYEVKEKLNFQYTKCQWMT